MTKLVAPGADEVVDCVHFDRYVARYRAGEWRTPLFRDLILADADRAGAGGRPLTFLDIGCGAGFDSDPREQAQLAARCSTYLGVEPDREIAVSSVVSEVHRCTLEEAPIEPASVDIAFAVMVVEHLEHPKYFWDKALEVLRPGGVFWAFSVDARHPFVVLSTLTERLGIKDAYLDWLHGARGSERYENYRVFYRSNAERDVRALTRGFSSVQVFNLLRLGQLDYYLPRGTRWIGRSYDHVALALGLPGVQLAVRARK